MGRKHLNLISICLAGIFTLAVLMGNQGQGAVSDRWDPCEEYVLDDGGASKLTLPPEDITLALRRWEDLKPLAAPVDSAYVYQLPLPLPHQTGPPMNTQRV